MYTPNNRILVIDDDKDLRDLLQQYLSRECFDVDCADGGAEMDIQLHEQRYDIIILDLMMPNEDGLSILRRIRPATRCPIIILSAKGQDTDKIIGLEVGADDYLAKPFNPRELLARIRALLRRHSTPQTAYSTELEPGKWPETRAKKPVVVFGQNTFNLQNHELLRNALPVKLTDSETHILTLFIKCRNKTLSRDDIIDALHGRDRDPFDRSIDIHITRLRKKLENDPSNPKHIRTVWARGYKFTPDNEC